MLDVDALAIPDGEGPSIPVKLVGDLEFRNHRRLLVPAAVAEVVRQDLADKFTSKEAAGPRLVEALGGCRFVAEFAVRLRPGKRKAVPLGKWGEIGVETG